MDEGNEGDKPSGDLQRDNINDTERQVAAIANAIAPSLVFAAAALPANLAEHLKMSLETRADQARESAVEAGFVRPSNELLTDGMTPQERERDRDAKSFSYAALVADEIEDRRQKEEASYQEWRQTRHTYAGQTMDGEDWHRLMTWFREPENVAAWEDAMMAETGQSRDEVRQAGGKMKRFYDLMEKDGRGTMTTAERAEFDKLNADKDVKRGIEVQQEIQGLQQSQTAKLDARNEASLDGGQSEKTKSFASTFADDVGQPTKLATAPPLSSIYRDAAIGAPEKAPAAAPSVAPSQTVTVSADNMFG